MNNKELAEITERFAGREKKLMAQALDLPYRTFQDYVYGKRKIPDHVAMAALDLILGDEQYMQRRYSPGGEFDQVLDREFPHGIMSEVPCEN